jgi:predicted amidophosphoribosyltransferase
MEATDFIIILAVLGGVFIMGVAWLMGVLTPKKQPETHCPFCDKAIQKGSTLCEWCGKEIPA